MINGKRPLFPGSGPCEATLKTLLNFLAANLFAVLPLLYVGFGWIPDRVKIELAGNSAQIPALVADGVVLRGNERAGLAGGTLWKFYLQDGMDWKDLAFRLPPGMDGSCVRRVRLEKWKLFALEKQGSELVVREGAGNDYAFPDPRGGKIGFADGRIALVLAGAELMLLGLSWLAARRHRPERWGTLLPSAIGVSFALAFLMQIALPVQSYVANQSAFPFTPGELGLAVGARFILALAGSVAALALLGRMFGRWVLSLAFAFAVCVYLESGLLSEGLPSLNDDWRVYKDLGRGLKDAAAWGGVFALVLGAHHWLKPWLGVAGLCMALMSAASLLDVRPEKKADTSNLIVHDFDPVETVIRRATYSTNRNVMVFIVDSLEREQAHAIMEDPEAGPELREQFRGFTEYTNNVGACEYSLPSVANLMTGRYPETTMDTDFFASVYADTSVLKDYLDAGYAVYLGTESLGYGYTNRKQGPEGGPREGKSVWAIHSLGNSGWGLKMFCRFRWLPFIAKEPYAVVVSLGRKPTQNLAYREQTAYPILMAGKISPDEKGCFLLLHTAGVHLPILFNRHGEQLPRADNTDKGYIENGIFIMKQLGNLLDGYRERGIFDQSLIVVLADHGRPYWNERTFVGNGRPFLWIKPPHCSHPFMADGAPTSHARIASLLAEALGRTLDDDAIQAVLSSEDRVYRREVGSDWHDFHVAPDNSWHLEVVPQNEIDVSRMRPIPLGKTIPLYFGKDEIRKREHIRFRGFPPKPDGKFFMGWKPSWSPLQKRVSFDFKVPSQTRTYCIRLIGTAWMGAQGESPAPGSCVLLSARGNGSVSARLCDEGEFEIVLDTVAPDADGIIEIAGDREEGAPLNLVFTQLHVSEMP